MRIELNNRQSTAFFLASAIALTLPYLYFAHNQYRAAIAAETLSQESLETSVKIEPMNADYHDMLGRYLLFVAQDTNRSAAEFKQAARLDPGSSRYWMDLATVMGMAGNIQEQRSALQNALKADPKTPQVAWEAGNFFLMDGNQEAALESFRTVIEYDPTAVRSALDLCWRATHDVNMVLAHAMPNEAGPHLELLRMLVEKRQTAAAMTAWRALASANLPYKAPDVMPLMEYLIMQHQINDAEEVWAGMSKLSPSLRPATSDGNLIVNGDFEEELVPGGFSWRLEPPASQTIRFDDREVQGGTTSVSFTFEGPTFSDYGFSQLVPVKPGQLYELRIWAKSQEIQSADGPRIMVQDAFSHAPLAKGTEWQGTHVWGEERILFSTLPETRLIKIYIGRVTGAGLIRGKLWLDHVRLYER